MNASEMEKVGALVQQFTNGLTGIADAHIGISMVLAALIETLARHDVIKRQYTADVLEEYASGMSENERQSQQGPVIQGFLDVLREIPKPPDQPQDSGDRKPRWIPTVIRGGRS